MSWEVHAISGLDGYQSYGEAVAGIVSEKLGSCSYNGSDKSLSYTYNGKTYTVPCLGTGSGLSAACVLALNTATGEFALSRATNSSKTTSATGGFIIWAIFNVQFAPGEEALVPVAKDTYQYINQFNLIATDRGENLSTYVVMVPAVTVTNYNYGVPNAAYKPILGMYTSPFDIASGTTISVAGERFLCIAKYLFEKL